MNAREEYLAWLEDQSGKRLPINASCSLGRGSSNQVPISDERVSRRHALIQMQRESEFWLVDFGSRNGTYLNDQRLTRPTRLRHGDRIKLGRVEFLFRHSQTSLADAGTVFTDRTVSDIRPAKCWLLVADIIGSTELVKMLSADELATLTGKWVAECKEIIEFQGGRINQFLGDGFFAYWRERNGIEQAVVTALSALKKMQRGQGGPGFRLSVHFGSVVIGGVSLGEEERISGQEVHFVFRGEDLASKLKEICLMSEAAAGRLADLIPTRALGSHALQGFDGTFAFFGF
jgi:class 3 adenylate cyclase